MRISVVGSGYVGLVTAACLADSGNHVIAVDNDHRKVDALQAGRCPFFEPGLEELVAKNVQAKRLRFSTDLRASVAGVRVVFLAVGTPPRSDGSADLTSIEAAATEIAAGLTAPAIVVTKSTVPVGTGDRLEALIAAQTPHRCPVVSNPEFLKEGTALADFLRPDRVIVGADDAEAGTGNRGAARALRAEQQAHPPHEPPGRRTHQVCRECVSGGPHQLHQRNRGSL